MKAGRDVPDSIGLDELVESRLRELLIGFRNGSAQDIEPELKSLAELIDAFSSAKLAKRTDDAHPI